MSIGRFRERLSVTSVRANDRIWFPRWVGRYLSDVPDGEAVVTEAGVSEAGGFHFCSRCETAGRRPGNASSDSESRTTVLRQRPLSDGAEITSAFDTSTQRQQVCFRDSLACASSLYGEVNSTRFLSHPGCRMSERSHRQKSTQCFRRPAD